MAAAGSRETVPVSVLHPATVASAHAEIIYVDDDAKVGEFPHNLLAMPPGGCRIRGNSSDRVFLRCLELAMSGTLRYKRSVEERCCTLGDLTVVVCREWAGPEVV